MGKRSFAPIAFLEYINENVYYAVEEFSIKSEIPVYHKIHRRRFTFHSQGEKFSKNVNKVAITIVDDSEQLEFFKKPKQPMLTQIRTISIRKCTTVRSGLLDDACRVKLYTGIHKRIY